MYLDVLGQAHCDVMVEVRCLDASCSPRSRQLLAWLPMVRTMACRMLAETEHQLPMSAGPAYRTMLSSPAEEMLIGLLGTGNDARPQMQDRDQRQRNPAPTESTVD